MVSWAREEDVAVFAMLSSDGMPMKLVPMMGMMAALLSLVVLVVAVEELRVVVPARLCESGNVLHDLFFFFALSIDLV